jgi:hypothetical protein
MRLLAWFALISMVLVATLGFGVLLVAIGYVYDKFFTWLLTYIGIKRDFVDFMWRKARGEIKPRRMSDEEAEELKAKYARQSRQ